MNINRVSRRYEADATALCVAEACYTRKCPCGSPGHRNAKIVSMLAERDAQIDDVPQNQPSTARRLLCPNIKELLCADLVGHKAS